MQVTLNEKNLINQRREKFKLTHKGDPCPGELCFIARKREEKTVKDITEALVTSHVSILNMERGTWSCRRLALYWNEAYGYDIPVDPKKKGSKKLIKMYSRKIADLQRP